MRTFSIHQVRNVLISIAVVALVGVLYFATSTPLRAPQAEAGVSQNITGWAWSDAIGWISLNSLTCDTNANGYTDTGICGGNDNATTPTSNYGVSVNVANKATGGSGNFSGYAWSERVGWISFERVTAGNPPAAPFNTGVPTDPIAQINWSTGAITGWAKVLVTSPGWDGWIKLAKHASDAGPSYGVSIVGNKFAGYAWWSDVVGWIDFAPTISGIPLGVQVAAPPCEATDPTIVWGACQTLSTCGPTDGGQTFTNQPGIKVGVCETGGTTVMSCGNTTTLICPSTATGTVKTRWWQF